MYGPLLSSESFFAINSNFSFAVCASSALSSRSSVSIDPSSSTSLRRFTYQSTKAFFETVPVLDGSRMATCSSNSSPLNPSPSSSIKDSSEDTGRVPTFSLSKVSKTFDARFASVESEPDSSSSRSSTGSTWSLLSTLSSSP